MVTVGEKAVTNRRAVARCVVTMLPATTDAIASGSLPKGDVLATARIAGIQGAKRTSDHIPLCHPLMLSAVSVDIMVQSGSVFSAVGKGRVAPAMVADPAISFWPLGGQRGDHFDK